MTTLLAIIATEHDLGRLERHWPYFLIPGWKILGCGTDDAKTRWPEKVEEFNTGAVGKRDTPAGSSIWGLCQQELNIWKYCFDHPEYDSVCVVEADNLFVRKPPEHPGDKYLITELPNYSPHFKTATYFSTPRWADRETAAWLYLCGTKMLKEGDHEHWMSDRFPAWICYKHGIPYYAEPNWSPSVNVGNDEQWLDEAKTAIRGGAWCLHAVKTEWQLNALKHLLPTI